MGPRMSTLRSSAKQLLRLLSEVPGMPLRAVDVALESDLGGRTLSAMLAAAVVFCTGWLVPSTFVLKSTYLRWVAKSPTMKAVVQRIPLLITLLVLVVLRERARLAAARRDIEARDTAVGREAAAMATAVLRARASSGNTALSRPRANSAPAMESSTSVTDLTALVPHDDDNAPDADGGGARDGDGEVGDADSPLGLRRMARGGGGAGTRRSRLHGRNRAGSGGMDSGRNSSGGNGSSSRSATPPSPTTAQAGAGAGTASPAPLSRFASRHYTSASTIDHTSHSSTHASVRSGPLTAPGRAQGSPSSPPLATTRVAQPPGPPRHPRARRAAGPAGDNTSTPDHAATHNADGKGTDETDAEGAAPPRAVSPPALPPLAGRLVSSEGSDAAERVLSLQSRMHRAATCAGLLLMLQRAYSLVEADLDLVLKLDEAAVEKEISHFTPPSAGTLERIVRPYRSLMSPVFLGLDNIPPEKPLLFVSNHTLMGFEFPLLLEGLFRRKGVFLRALADHSHFQIPVNGWMLRNVLGMADGTPRNLDLLMQSGASVFVYPGGARETFKKTTDKRYELFWERRKGFARMAIKHKVTIVPVINVGTEDMTEVVYDLPMGWLPIPFLWGGDRTFPLLKMPRVEDLQRVYFAFGRPIPTEQYAGRFEDSEAVDAVHAAAEREVLGGIEFLKTFREADSGRWAVDRIPALAKWIDKKHRRFKLSKI